MLPRVIPRRPEPPTRRMSRRVTPRWESQRSLPGWPGMQSIDMAGSFSGVVKAGWAKAVVAFGTHSHPGHFAGGTGLKRPNFGSRRTIAVLAGECQSFDCRYRLPGGAG